MTPPTVAVPLDTVLDALREMTQMEYCGLLGDAEYQEAARRGLAALEEVEEMRAAVARVQRLLNEIDCRIEHGAESNGHLEAIRERLSRALEAQEAADA